MLHARSPSAAHRLRAFDIAARDLRGDYADHGAGGAEDALVGLHAFAHTLAAAVGAMEADSGQLPLPAGARFESPRAARLLLESVFDELLAPPAWRVLAAAVDLALEGA